MADIVRKKHGGRKKGTPNSDKRELKSLLAEKFPDYHPVVAMAAVANDKTADPILRFQAHKEVAKYVSPQLKSIEMSNPDGTLQNTLTIIRQTLDKPTP